MTLRDISMDENRRALPRVQCRAPGPRQRDSVPRTKAASAAESERSPAWPSLTGRFSRERLKVPCGRPRRDSDSAPGFGVELATRLEAGVVRPE